MQTIDIPKEYAPLFRNDWREAAVYGGRYSMKSHTAARFLLIEARQRKTRVACFREYQNSISESSHQLLKDLIEMYGMEDFRVTDNSIINTENGSDFLFKGLRHNEQSIKSIEGIDIAWVEEAQTVSKSSIEVLTPTVRKPGSRILYTYNRLLEDDPVHVRLVVEGRPNTLVLNVNYDIALKYGWMPDAIRLEMEDDRDRRPGLFRHKWLGEPNNVEGRIYKDWQEIETVPHEARLIRRGLDFGYSHDPAAVVDVYYHNGGYILDERLYRTRMLNPLLADFLLSMDDQSVTVTADSAEPKSIDEIRMSGVPVEPVKKGADSIRAGILKVQGLRISYTRRSSNLRSEYLGYFWDTDLSGRYVQKPAKSADHLLDAARYALDGMAEPVSPPEIVGYEEGMGGAMLPVYDF